MLNLFMLLMVFINDPGTAEGQLRTYSQSAFKRGEVINYKVHYGFIDAGTIRLEVMPETKMFGSRSSYHIVGSGQSISAFDWFFKVRDRYETYIDDKAMIPWMFVRHIEEGTYRKDQFYVFNHYKKTVKVKNEEFKMIDNAQDMLSSFYFARSIDFSKAKEGEVFDIPTFVDQENFVLKIRYMGKETVKTDAGTFRCIKFRPVVQRGRVFKKEEDLNVWVTDDGNKIPVRAQANILVGSIKMDLTSYSNVSNPLARVK